MCPDLYSNYSEKLRKAEHQFFNEAATMKLTQGTIQHSFSDTPMAWFPELVD